MKELEVAYQNLGSHLLSVRLRAARYLSDNFDKVDSAILRDYLQAETVPWVRESLLDTIKKLEVSVPRPNETSGIDYREEVSDRLARSLKAQAAEEITGTILHEVGTVVGSIQIKAALEFPGYQNSQTALLFKKLNDILKAIRNLKKASTSPVFEEFDLAELVEEITRTSLEHSDKVVLTTIGAKPCPTVADKGSLLLSIINGLRNASESLSVYSRKIPAEIIIRWGTTETEMFLTIEDSGEGFKGNPNDALKIGVSSKKDHMGYGLATAQCAIRAMEGELFVTNSLDGGAIFELKWFRENENSVS